MNVIQKRKAAAKSAQQPHKKAGLRAKVGSFLCRMVSFGAAILVLFLLLPYCLVPLYQSSIVHPVSVLMAQDALMFGGYHRQWLPLDDISPVFVRSVMISEDARFCQHHGIDFIEMEQSVKGLLNGSSSRGASSISMQSVKNLFLWNGRSYLRKGIEMPLALFADWFWGKRRMMELYLNIAQWGPGIFGADAAAHFYFGVSARHLRADQAALLAVSLPNPLLRHANQPTQKMKNLAARIKKQAYASLKYTACLDLSKSQ